MTTKPKLLDQANMLLERSRSLASAIESSTHPVDDATVLEEHKQLQDWFKRLDRILVQPSDFMFQLSVSQQLSTCIHWLCHFKVVFNVPIDMDQSISFEDLAARSNVSSGTMKAVIRMAVIHGFLRETDDCQVQHTPLSAAFATDPDMYNWMMWLAEETAPTVAAFVKASERWPNSESKRRTAYTLSRHTIHSFFDHINQSPELAKKFADYMKSQAASNKKQGTSIDVVSEAFDWGALGEATVVDVGGNNGDVCVSLAQRFERLSFIVQDLPNSIQAARKRLDGLPSTIAKRIRFHEHNFFESQPIKGALAYILRMILHDWSDQDCVSILSQLKLAMQPGSRLIIVEIILPRPGTVPLEEEAVMRQKDLMMRQTFNSRERELDEWKALLAQIGLDIASVVTPKGSHHSVLEVVKLEKVAMMQ